jgi:hypothetical protein
MFIVQCDGCGGGCVKVHVIIQIDPKNSRAAREQENIRKHVAAQKAAATTSHPERDLT